MESIINVLASIDAESIIDEYGKNTDPNNPTPVDSKYIHMVVKDTNAFSGQGGGNLEIAASVLDQIRWRSTSLCSRNGTTNPPKLASSQVTGSIMSPNG